MELVIERAALQALRAMPRKRADSLLARLKKIACDPFAHHANVERLSGAKDAYRLRQGPIRAVYQLDRTSQEMRVELIASRGEVYK
ncbi:MAG: type II toxin-antitoxin system RelE/ParE family toxin [Rhodospirillaceae bacterium]|nr:type II toxin-antitoxin system RelE/ParE family toxin [Rhodospirillaceae bacterium]